MKQEQDQNEDHKQEKAKDSDDFFIKKQKALRFIDVS